MIQKYILIHDNTFMNLAGEPTVELQCKLLLEELKELEESKDRENTLKEIADVEYVLAGIVHLVLSKLKGYKEDFTFLAVDEAYRRVIENNNSKVQGEIKRNKDGKVLKPKDYKPVDLSDLI